MKLEVEVDDNIYRRLKEHFGDQFDLTGLLAYLTQQTVVAIAMFPDISNIETDETQRNELTQFLENLNNSTYKKFLNKSKEVP